MNSRQRGRHDSLNIQAEEGTQNVNRYFYEIDARRIAVLNELFEDVELAAAEAKRREQPLRP